MLDADTVRQLEQHWEEGWNQADVDTIMAPFGEAVVFSSPFVARLTGDPEHTAVHGYDAVRSYVADSLVRAPGIRYTLDCSYVGTESVLLSYTVHLPDGTTKTGVDSMRVDGAGKVVEWRCHYSFDASELDHVIRD